MNEKCRFKIKKGEVEIEIEGDKAYVEEYVEKYVKIYIEESWKEKQKSITELSSKENFSNETLADHYKRYKENAKKVKFKDIILIFAYWLNKREGKEEFKEKDIENYFREIRVKKPRNIRQYFYNLSKENGYLVEGSAKGLWKLTLEGEEYVKKLLSKDNE